MLIKDLQSNTVRKYGTDHHDSLAISYDGTSLHYYNLQNGDGSRGDYRFVMEDGEVPKDSNTDDAKYGECYFNIGGFPSMDRIVNDFADYLIEEYRAEVVSPTWLQLSDNNVEFADYVRKKAKEMFEF